jgi:hypothetical protein
VPAAAIPEVAAFGWVAGTVIGDAACLTLVRSADPYLVARGFGGDPAGARPVTLAEAAEAFPDSSWLAVRAVGFWVLAVEVNGWQGARPEVLERLSAGTWAVSVYWNVNGQTRFSLAAAGHVLTTFDPQFPDRRDGADPDGLEAVRAGLPWDDALPRPLALALAARVTGHPARPSWPGGTFEVIPVEALPEGLRPATDPDTEPLSYDDPPLVWALRRSAGEQQRAAALAVARYAVRVAGLEDHPDVRLALAGDGRAAAEGLAKLSAALDRGARKSAGDPRPAGRGAAIPGQAPGTRRGPSPAS